MNFNIELFVICVAIWFAVGALAKIFAGATQMENSTKRNYGAADVFFGLFTLVILGACLLW